MTRKKIVIELVVLIVVVVVVELISSFSFSRHYHAISLSNASCIIPIRMWSPDEDDVSVSDHSFKIKSGSGRYEIYGCQLEQYNEEDKAEGIIDSDIASDLIAAEKLEQIQSVLKNKSSIIKDITHTYEYSRSTFNSYRIIGNADGDYAGYTCFISILKQYDMCFIEVILYRDENELSEKEMQKIMLNMNWHQDRSNR